MSLTIGDSYRTRNTDFLRNNGIPDGVDYVITNTQGDKVSLFMKYAHGKQSPQRLTVSKPCFSVNFENDPYSPIQESYASKDHYFPDVNEQSIPVWPSPHYKREK
jgi:hypothetical protein